MVEGEEREWERGAWRVRYPDGRVAPCGILGSWCPVWSNRVFAYVFVFVRKRRRRWVVVVMERADGEAGAFKTDAFCFGWSVAPSTKPISHSDP